jgi:hypothetical protein
MIPPDDPHCWTLLCQAAVGMMTWFDVFMFVFAALLGGFWLGWRFGDTLLGREARKLLG